MNEQYLPVNWVDGMKITKAHFLQSDNASTYQTQQAVLPFLSPVHYGLIPVQNTGHNNFAVSVSCDNQNTVNVSITALEAITLGGCRISIQQSRGDLAAREYHFAYQKPDKTAVWWLVVTVNAFDRQPFGQAAQDEMSPRQPYLSPAYEVQLVKEGEFNQYLNNPNSLFIGKLYASANEVVADQDYIPPCTAMNAHPDLHNLLGELDSFLSHLEQKSIQIIQKIFARNQQNELSELVHFVCERTVANLNYPITQFRWYQQYLPPAFCLGAIVAVARTIKNAVDMRLGSGKEEMMNYLVEWSDLKQGELDSLLAEVASIAYNPVDINQSIVRMVDFVQSIARLFDTISKLEYIGKKKSSGYFVNEMSPPAEATAAAQPAAKPKRRFFG